MIHRRSSRWFRPVMFALVLFLDLAWSPWTLAAAQDSTDAEAMLQHSAEAMLALESFHFAVSTPTGKTLLTDQVELSGIEGDVVRPDRFRAEFTVSLGFVTIDFNVIGIGSDIWATDPMSGNDSYIRLGGEGDENLPPLALLNPDQLVLQAVNMLSDPQIVGEEKIDGITTTNIEGVFDPNGLASPGAPEPGELLSSIKPLTVNLWLDAEDRIVRAEFAGPLLRAETNAGRIVRRVALSAFNEQVLIEAPRDVD